MSWGIDSGKYVVPGAAVYGYIDLDVFRHAVRGVELGVGLHVEVIHSCEIQSISGMDFVCKLCLQLLVSFHRFRSAAHQ
jgi:hypothetical protein